MIGTFLKQESGANSAPFNVFRKYWGQDDGFILNPVG